MNKMGLAKRKLLEECFDCGFFSYTKEDRMNLEELNELRKDMDLKPIKKLPKWEEE